MPDLFDPSRLQYAVKANLPKSLRVSTVAVYLQQALNRLGVTDNIGAALRVDGQPGPKTFEAVNRFQEHQRIPRTDAVDRVTWYHLDWCVYDGWTPAPTSMTSTVPNGPAIVNGRNRYGGWPVDVRGMSREGKRLWHVTNSIAPIDYRPNWAVDRNTRGSKRLSWHAYGLANDDMVDLDKDRRLEPHEIAQANMVADAMIARCNGWPTEVGERGGQVTSFCGPDRLAIAVWGNHKDPETGRWHFPLTLGVGRNDWAWNAKRRTWRPLTSKIHGNHLHLDVVPGAPIWVAP